jgi:DNA-binding protein H-NS
MKSFITCTENEEMSKYQELRQQAEALLREAEEARKHELAAVIADIKGKIAEFGLTAGDLGFHGRGAAGARGRDGRGSAAPKYRDPASGSTWSGRGRKPRWLEAAIKNGQSAEHFLIHG